MRRILGVGLLGFALAFVSACNGTTDPDDCGCVSGAGTITATLDGQPYNPVVSATKYTAIEVASPNQPARDFFQFAANATDQGELVVTAPARTGTVPVGFGVIDPVTGIASVGSARLTFLPANGASGAPGAWMTSLVGGSGTIVIDNVSTSSASGSFQFTLAAAPGSTPASRQMTGTFAVTFD